MDALLEMYLRLLDLVTRMSELAETSQWDELTSLDNEKNKLILQLEHQNRATPLTSLSEPHQLHLREMIEKILALNAALIQVVSEQKKGEVSPPVQTNHVKKMQAAYNIK